MPHSIRQNAEFILQTYEKLTGTISTDQIGVILSDFAAYFRFKYHYIIHIPEIHALHLRPSFVLHNWPDHLIQTYDEKSLLSHSPVISGLRKSREPVQWTLDDLHQRFPPEIAADVVDLFEKNGMKMGVCFPSFDAQGRAGAVCFAGERSMPYDGELAAMHMLAHYLFWHLSVMIQAMTGTQPELTRRERECVGWASEGKTISETAQIIGISSNTVNTYLVSAMRKLNVVNKAHMVATAIRKGVIH